MKAWPNRPFYFRNIFTSLVAHIPINYPALIPEIKNIPRNNRRDSWVRWRGQGGFKPLWRQVKEKDARR